jgi:hypothetical protein
MIGAAVLVIVALAGPVLAQVQPAQDRINAAIARARQVGVPVALLESKIAEGKAKNVSMDRIAAAVERREGALERASEALRGRPEVGAADLSVAADALESGVSEAILRAIGESAPRERRAVAIAALTELVELGHVPEAALDRVREALKRGPDALANLPAEAGQAGGRGNGPPETSGPARGRAGASAGPPPSVPAPGRSSQPTKPGGPPSSTPNGGRPTGPGTGRGGA